MSLGQAIIGVNCDSHACARPWDLDRLIATHCFLPVNNTGLRLGPARMHALYFNKEAM